MGTMQSDMNKYFHSHNLSLNFNITGFEIENNYRLIENVVEIQRRNWTLSIWASLLYVAGILMLKRLMVNYARFDLSKPLALWNGVLALFSVAGTVRMVPSLYYSLRYESFHHSVCSYDWNRIPVLALWSGLFTVSKIFELGDTVFIILRKSPLIFLHWYHHVTVLIYTWYSQYDRSSSSKWFGTMNFAIHSVMYSYYALRALRYKAPNWVKMCITVLQLSQMLVGCFISIYLYCLKRHGIPCQVSNTNLSLCSAMYLSYLGLFGKFFYETYIVCPKASKDHGEPTRNGGTISGHANGNFFKSKLNSDTKKKQ